MSRPVFSFQGYTPKIIEPSTAIHLPPAFARLIESLYIDVSAAVQSVCKDSVIYKKTFDSKKVAELINSIIKRRFLSQPDAHFWLEIESHEKGFRLKPNFPVLNQAREFQQWEIDSSFKDVKTEYSPLPKGIIHLGHAGICINYSAQILIDPIFFEAGPRNSIEAINMSSLGDIDGIFFTHYHGDHFDVDTLVQIPRSTPIFVPAPLDRVFEPDMAALLDRLGFTNINRVKSGDRINFKDGSFVDILPFYGEGSEVVGFGAYCPLYTGNARRILFHADSGPNYQGESILKSELLDRLVKTEGPIDTVFGTWWQNRDFLFRLSPMILISDRFSSNDWLQITESCDCTPEYFADLLRKIGATRFVTYAERGGDSFNPLEVQSSYIESTSFFWQSRNEFIQKLHRLYEVKTFEAIPRQCF